jgi:hypothetical protein
MLLTKKIKINVVPTNFKNLKQFYDEIKLNEVIEINVNELSNNSTIKVESSCEICGDIIKLRYRDYLRNIKRYNYYSCKKCKNLKTNITKELLYGDPLYNNSKKMILTKENTGIYIPAEMSSDFQRYRKLVNRFTNKFKKQLFENWNGLDFYDNENIQNNFNLLSKDMSYPTIDHKISLKSGFLKNIPPYIIGNINNLCITKRKINLLKSDNDTFV